tara:strand:- start:1109 stop:1435 length:327 start_codon:yes stop_codon:yes gene_type:complete
MENATERRTKKTVDREAYMRQYMKEYRVKNKAYLNNVERSRYFKSQGMSPELMKQFGEISGLVYKMKNLFLEILYNNPEIGEKVIEELLKVEEGELVNPPQEIAALIV